MLSGKQINKLGDRLRDAETPAEEDLLLFQDLLSYYGEALQVVRSRLKEADFAPTTRLKTTSTFVDKLRRERGKLTH